MRFPRLARFRPSKQFRWAFLIIAIAALLSAFRGAQVFRLPGLYIPLTTLTHISGPFAALVFSPPDLLTLHFYLIAAVSVFLVFYFEFRPNLLSRCLAIIGYVVWFLAGELFTYQYAW
jgi:hypothetical protein